MPSAAVANEYATLSPKNCDAFWSQHNYQAVLEAADGYRGWSVEVHHRQDVGASVGHGVIRVMDFVVVTFPVLETLLSGVISSHHATGHDQSLITAAR